MTERETWLLRLPNWVGDAVMVLPAVRALKESARLVGVAHPRVVPLYEASGDLDVVLPAPGWITPIALSARVRAEHPTRALVFTTSPAGGLLASLSGAPQRMGFQSGAGDRFLTDILPTPDRDRPLAESYLELAYHAGGDLSITSEMTRLEAPPAAVARAATLMGPESGRHPVALAPGASFGPAKRWPLESYVALCRELRARGRRVVALGGDDERSMGEALSDAGAVDLTGRTSLLEAMAVLERCSALVTNDSGALHLARAAGIPVVAIFGSSSPAWTGPGEREGKVIRHLVACSPCYKHTCPLRGEDHLKCLTRIDVAEVLEAVEQVGAKA